MKLYLENGNWVDTEKFYDLSIPMTNDEENPRAWYVDPPVFEPVRAHGFIGSVAEGGSVNFRNIFFNPHGHGTHTECLGHITQEVHSVNKVLDHFICKALVVSIHPQQTVNPTDGKLDQVITSELLDREVRGRNADALIIRTLPNEPSKLHRNYSAQNPPFLSKDCIELIDRMGVKHLLIDTPSVDREEDGGELAFHHAFWKINEGGDFRRTITEMIYVPDQAEDGFYLMDLQMAAFENDASPSRPVIYPIWEK